MEKHIEEQHIGNVAVKNKFVVSVGKNNSRAIILRGCQQ